MDFQEKIEFLKRKISQELRPLLSETCILLDLPYYTNIGDTLIWEGTESLVKMFGCNCLYRASVNTYKYKKIPIHTTVLLQGGGNFGDIWRAHQEFRLKVIEDYPNNRIVILPQTVYYENEEVMKEDARKCQEHPDLVICARDMRSYSLLKKYFFKNRILLLPDMAFCIPLDRLYRFRSKTEDKILFLKRIDKEQLNACPGLLPLPENGTVIETKDWPSMEEPSWIIFVFEKLLALNTKTGNSFGRLIDCFAYTILRKHFISTGVKFVSRYRYIYTTRLHVAILSTLLAKPYLFLDNSYGKNRTFYMTWLSDLKEVEFI